MTAISLGVQLQKIHRVLDVLWASSSYKTLQEIWQSYPALYKHFSDFELSSTAKKTATYAGLKTMLASPLFVQSSCVVGCTGAGVYSFSCHAKRKLLVTQCILSY